MKPFHKLIVLLMILSSLNKACKSPLEELTFKWDELPQIPDLVGFAGSFAGVSNDALIVAGGANFPDGGAPWTGSKKKWHNDIFVLESESGTWKKAGKLPFPLGYGVSVSWNNTLLCFGGNNEKGHFNDVWMIRYEGGKILFDTLPPMPSPIANAAGTLVGEIVYIAGGIASPESTESESAFWALDLSKAPHERRWEVLPSWPGPSRILSVSGSLDNTFYLFSGANLKAGKREYLSDAYKYEPRKGWSKLASLPHAVVAAPSTAFASKEGHLLIFGGDDGQLAPVSAQLKEKHPGFSRSVLSYDTASNEWKKAGVIPTRMEPDSITNPQGSSWAPVTTASTIWNGNLILPGGEVRPATRTTRVLRAVPVYQTAEHRAKP